MNEILKTYQEVLKVFIDTVLCRAELSNWDFAVLGTGILRNTLYGYPRDVQSEVWKKWFDIRNEKNVILKMNARTGATK